MSGRTEEIRGWMEEEQRVDRRLHLAAKLGWSTAVVAVVIYGVFRIFAVVDFLRQLEAQAIPRGAWFEAAQHLMPIVYALGALGLLGGVLATIGSFVRFRTANLAEIQLRLAAIEEALLDRERDGM